MSYDQPLIWEDEDNTVECVQCSDVIDESDASYEDDELDPYCEHCWNKKQSDKEEKENS